MRNTFKNFLSERSNYEPPENNGGGGGDDDYFRHVDEYSHHLNNAMQSVPFVHNTNLGTYKWENLADAIKAHASEAAHSTFLLSSPEELGDLGDSLRTIGSHMLSANERMKDQIRPHLERAIRMALPRLSEDNPFKRIDARDLADREFEQKHNAAIMHINHTARHNNLSVPRFLMYMAPQIVEQIENHGPHGFMLKGGHFGIISRGEDEAHPRFFPKWNGSGPVDPSNN
jgi:hypothetical protein